MCLQILTVDTMIDIAEGHFALPFVGGKTRREGNFQLPDFGLFDSLSNCIIK